MGRLSFIFDEYIAIPGVRLLFKSCGFFMETLGLITENQMVIGLGRNMKSTRMQNFLGYYIRSTYNWPKNAEQISDNRMWNRHLEKMILGQ